MLIETQQNEVSSSGLLSVHKATIASTRKSFEVYAKQIYSDNIKAIVGEYTSNGRDSHREAGSADPVHVYLPDDFDPYFRVKDTGMGMSHLFATTRFMCYNTSTKDGSDADVGGFGVGSKSGLSYADQVTMRSAHDGTLSIYSMFKDEEGVPSLGLLQQSPTNEPNGVEFSIAVEPEDFSRFREAALDRLQYLTDEILLHGAQLEAPDYIQRGDTWGVRPTSSGSNPQVIMGGMAYPIVRNQMDYDLRYDDRLGPLLQAPIDLFLPIGACNITLSRESMLYDDRTKDSIKHALESFIDEITADIPTMFDHLSGRWAASKALEEYLGGNNHLLRSRLVLQHSQYQGEALRFDFKSDPGGFEKVWIINERAHVGRRSGPLSCSSPKWEDILTYVHPSSYHTVIIDDLPQTSKSATIKRIKTFVDEDLDKRDKVLVIRPWDLTDIAPALAAFGNLQPEDYILASSLPEPERMVRDKSIKLVRSAVRMFQLSNKGLNDKSSVITPRRWSSPVREIQYSDQPATGILVAMDNFTLPDMFWKKFFLFDHTELFFANKGDADKLKNFEQFEDVFQRRLAEKLAEVPTLAQSTALRSSALGDLFELNEKSPELLTNVAKSKPLYQLRNLAETYMTLPNYPLLPFITPALPPRLDPEALMTKIKATHWQFLTFHKHCDRCFYDPQTPEFKLLKELV